MTIQKVTPRTQIGIGLSETRPRDIHAEKGNRYLGCDVGCPPLMMIAMSWLGWLTRWRKSKELPDAAEPVQIRSIVPAVLKGKEPPIAPPFILDVPDPLSCARFGASSDVIVREARLCKPMGKDGVQPVYIVTSEGQLVELLSYFRGANGDLQNMYDKYTVVTTADNVVELRVASGYHGIEHFDMFKPDEGEKVVGAGYWHYAISRGELHVDGKSGGFQTLENLVLTSPTITRKAMPRQSLVAHNSGMKYVRALMRASFSTIPMKFV